MRQRRGKFDGEMAHLKIKRLGNGSYYYIVQSVRREGKVRQKILEYLGRDPDPARLRAALKYWKVGGKRKAKKKGGN